MLIWGFESLLEYLSTIEESVMIKFSTETTIDISRKGKWIIETSYTKFVERDSTWLVKMCLLILEYRSYASESLARWEELGFLILASLVN